MGWAEFIEFHRPGTTEKRQERKRLSSPPSLPIMRVLLEKGYPEDAIGDIKTQGQAERIIELWPKAEKPLPPLMGTRRIWNVY